MTGAAGKTDAQIADEALAELLRSGTAQAQYAAAIGEECPQLAAGTVLALVSVITDRVDEQVGIWTDRPTLHVVNGHAEVRTVRYPNGEVGEDANGYLTRVCVDASVEVE